MELVLTLFIDFSFYQQSTPPSQTQTVVVENPMSVDESGKLVSISITCVLLLIYHIRGRYDKVTETHKLQVSNVVVGVTTDKK